MRQGRVERIESYHLAKALFEWRHFSAVLLESVLSEL